MKYRHFDTGDIYKLEEIKRDYELFKWDMSDDPQSFGDYFQELLTQGKNGTGGFVEVEEG